MKHLFYTILMVGLLSIGCEPAINQVEEYPIGEVLSVNKISTDGVEVEGRAYSNGFYEVLESGIVWLPAEELPSYLPGKGNTLAFESPLTVGRKFKVSIERNLWPGQKYYLRFYQKTGGGIVYSPFVVMLSQGAKKQAFIEHGSYSGFNPGRFGGNITFSLQRDGVVYFLTRNGNVLVKYEVAADRWSSTELPYADVLGADDRFFYVRPVSTEIYAAPFPLLVIDPVNLSTRIVNNSFSQSLRRDFHFAQDGALFIGYSENETWQLWKMNPNTGALEQKGNPPFTASFLGNPPFSSPSILTIGKRVFAIQFTKTRNTLWEYLVDQDRWESRADFPGKTNETYWYGVNEGKIYCGNIQENQSDYWSYETSTNQWTPIGWLPINLAFLHGFNVNDRLYLIGNNTTSGLRIFSFKEN